MVGFEAKIKQLCREHNVTQKQLYSELGVTDSGMRKMFARNSCEVAFLEKIAEYFKIPIGVFFDSREGNIENIMAADNSTAFKGNGNTVLNESGSERFLDLLTKKDEQIDRLLSIIEKMK